MSGSRLLFWLQALTSAFKDSGYWSGVVICFSMSEPMMRASLAVRRMFMREVYWPRRVPPTPHPGRVVRRGRHAAVHAAAGAPDLRGAHDRERRAHAGVLPGHARPAHRA